VPVKVPEILQIETSQVPGTLASVLNVIAEAGLLLEPVSTVRREQGRTLWEITLEIEEGAQQDLLQRLSSLASARFIGWSDRVFERHRGGKIEMGSRIGISTQQILRDIYTPGVARVVVTDGSAILGRGNIGPWAGLPVMEGK
jgi:malate dehydrogenase (oxaloacetate-decarboxylating)